MGDTRRRILRLAFACAALACGESTGPDLSIHGVWKSADPIDGICCMELEIVFAEDDGELSGIGTLGATLSPEKLPIDVNGVRSGSSVSLTISSGLHPPFNFTGSRKDNVIRGVINGSGFEGDSVRFFKH